MTTLDTDFDAYSVRKEKIRAAIEYGFQNDLGLLDIISILSTKGVLTTLPEVMVMITMEYDV